MNRGPHHRPAPHAHTRVPTRVPGTTVCPPPGARAGRTTSCPYRRHGQNPCGAVGAAGAGRFEPLKPGHRLQPLIGCRDRHEGGETEARGRHPPRRDQGAGVVEYAALLTLIASIAATLTVVAPRVAEPWGTAAERALDPGSTTTGHEGTPFGDGEPDPVEIAETVLRCLPTPDPVGRVDCALALLGLLDSDLLEATLLQLTPEELHGLFAGGRFDSTVAARTAVRLVWEHGSRRLLRALAETETFGFLLEYLDSPEIRYTLRFVGVGRDYVRVVLERSGE